MQCDLQNVMGGNMPLGEKCKENEVLWKWSWFFISCSDLYTSYGNVISDPELYFNISTTGNDGVIKNILWKCITFSGIL